MRAVGMGVENFSRLPRRFPSRNDADTVAVSDRLYSASNNKNSHVSAHTDVGMTLFSYAFSMA